MFKAGDEPAFFLAGCEFYMSFKKSYPVFFPHELARDLWNPLESNNSADFTETAQLSELV
jgi:hypothetical protein